MPETPSWEFLLQQDGDRAWLSIDTPTVEILEGRYRIAAKSNYKNVPVEVLIRHDATEEDPPKRRVQKHTYQTNQKGLMVVIPYTELEPGLWEFRCTHQAPIEGLENPTHSIQFHVLPNEADPLEDWNFDWTDTEDEELAAFSIAPEEPTQNLTQNATVSASIAPETVVEPTVVEPVVEPAEPAVEPVADITADTNPSETTEPSPISQAETLLAGKSVSEILQLATQQSDQLADEVLHEYGLASDDDNADETAIAATVASPQTFPQESEFDGDSSLPRDLLGLSIVLDQDIYVVQRGQTFVLSGRLIPDFVSESPLILNQAELSVCLRDPQTAEVLLETSEVIENQTLPAALTYPVQLPETLNTQLVLGEFILRDHTTETSPILASQPFTLTAAVQDLLDAVRQPKPAEFPNRNFAEGVPESPPVAPKAPTPLNLTFLNFVQAPKTQGENFMPVVGQVLPPQLYTAGAGEPGKRTIDLPNFGDRPPEATSDMPTQLEIPIPADFFVERPAEQPPAEDALAKEIEQLEIELEPQEAPALSPDPFFDLLSALAEKPAPSEELKAIADDVSDSSDLPEELVALLPPFTTVEIAPNPDPSDGEFVVDDEPILPVTDLVLARQQKTAEAFLERPANPLLLPDDQPVPEPTIALAATELEPGKPVLVTVKLPDVLPKIYVKLWINDRQSRAVLEPPRWIVDFTPNGLGNLEATAELTVPMGSVEVQIEAVTVEVMTNRESRKVSVDRPVLPSQQPDFLGEDFEV